MWRILAKAVGGRRGNLIKGCVGECELRRGALSMNMSSLRNTRKKDVELRETFNFKYQLLG